MTCVNYWTGDKNDNDVYDKLGPPLPHLKIQITYSQSDIQPWDFNRSRTGCQKFSGSVNDAHIKTQKSCNFCNFIPFLCDEGRNFYITCWVPYNSARHQDICTRIEVSYLSYKLSHRQNFWLKIWHRIQWCWKQNGALVPMCCCYHYMSRLISFAPLNSKKQSRKTLRSKTAPMTISVST